MWLQRYGFEAVLVLTWRLKAEGDKDLGESLPAVVRLLA